MGSQGFAIIHPKWVAPRIESPAVYPNLEISIRLKSNAPTKLLNFAKFEKLILRYKEFLLSVTITALFFLLGRGSQTCRYKQSSRKGFFEFHMSDPGKSPNVSSRNCTQAYFISSASYSPGIIFPKYCTTSAHVWPIQDPHVVCINYSFIRIRQVLNNLALFVRSPHNINFNTKIIYYQLSKVSMKL